MIKRLAPAALLGFLLTACASGSPPGPPPLDPTGTFDATIQVEGMELVAVMVIEGSAAEGFTGTIDTEMGIADMTGIVVTGQALTFDILDPGVTFTLTFLGDEFTGGFSGEVGSGTINGIRRPRG